MPISDDHLRAIGLVSVNFQYVESYIAFVTWWLIGSDSAIAQAVTSQLSFRKLCDLCDTLVRLRTQDEAVLAAVRHLMTKAADAEGRRNQLLHSMWIWSDDGSKDLAIRIKQTARRNMGLRLQYETVDVAELNKFAAELKDLTGDAILLLDMLMEKGLIRPSNA
jgi:hypothetical protein